MTTFQTVNRWLAQEMHAAPGYQHRHVAHNDTFAIRVMRGALETAQTTPDLNPPEIFVPAAVSWLSILGPKMYAWAKESSYGGQFGNRGTGGPLWYGKHGYCIERWNFWKQRFDHLSSSELVSYELQGLAEKGAAKMMQIESLDLDYPMYGTLPMVMDQTHAGHLQDDEMAMEEHQGSQLGVEGMQPAETTPAETTPAETTPAETKPAETKPAETKPAETKPAETKPAERKETKTYVDILKNKPGTKR